MKGCDDGQAAVDDERLPVDIARLVGGEEQRRIGDLDRRAAALQRVQMADLVLLPLGPGPLEDELGHAGLDQAGADGVDPDIGAGQLGRGDLDQVDHARLGRRIGRPARAGAQAGDRGGGDDRPAAALLHRRRGIFDRQERADQIDPQYLRPIGRILLEDAVEAAGNAGVGEEDVEPAMVANRMGDQRLDLLLVAGVAFEVRAVEVGADHGRAFAAEQLDASPCRCREPAPVTIAILPVRGVRLIAPDSESSTARRRRSSSGRS